LAVGGVLGGVGELLDECGRGEGAGLRGDGAVAGVGELVDGVEVALGAFGVEPGEEVGEGEVVEFGEGEEAVFGGEEVAEEGWVVGGGPVACAPGSLGERGGWKGSAGALARPVADAPGSME